MERENRPSPSVSATIFKIGTIKKGNDGNMWVIKENANGVKRWTKQTSKQTAKQTSKRNSKRNSKTNSKTNVVSNKNISINYIDIIDNIKDLHAGHMRDENEKLIPEYQEAAKKWREYLKPAFEELLEYGIVAFLYPLGRSWIDSAWEDVGKRIGTTKKIIDFYKNYGFTVNPKLEKETDIFSFILHIDNLPFIFYMAPSATTTQLYLKFNLENRQTKVLQDFD